MHQVEYERALELINQGYDKLIVAQIIVPRPGSFSYFVTPPPARVEADQRLPPAVLYSRGPDTTASTSIDQRPSAGDKDCRSLPKSRRGDPKTSSECTGVRRRRWATHHGAHPVAKEAPDHAPLTLGAL